MKKAVAFVSWCFLSGSIALFCFLASCRTFFEQMPFSRGNPWKDARWPGLQDILAKALTAAIAGDDVARAAKAAQKEFEELLEE